MNDERRNASGAAGSQAVPCNRNTKPHLCGAHKGSPLYSAICYSYPSKLVPVVLLETWLISEHRGTKTAPSAIEKRRVTHDPQILWRFLDTRYEITVSNPDRRCRGVVKAELDGLAVNPASIPLADDGRIHQVRVVLGST